LKIENWYLSLPTSCKKTISKPGGGAGRLCREVAAQCGGYFPKVLHLPARSRFGEGRAAPFEVGYMLFYAKPGLHLK